MTNKAIEKRKELRLKKKGLTTARKITSPILEEIRKNRTLEQKEKVRKWFNEKELEFKTRIIIRNLKGDYRRYNRPKTPSQWKVWYQIFPPKVGYLESL